MDINLFKIASLLSTLICTISEMLPFLNSINGNGIIHSILLKLRASKGQGPDSYQTISQDLDQDTEDDSATITKYTFSKRHIYNTNQSSYEVEYRKLQRLFEKLNARMFSIETKLSKLTRDVRQKRNLY